MKVGAPRGVRRVQHRIYKAVVSSQIEGTQVTLVDLLSHEDEKVNGSKRVRSLLFTFAKVKSKDLTRLDPFTRLRVSYIGKNFAAAKFLLTIVDDVRTAIRQAAEHILIPKFGIVLL